MKINQQIKIKQNQSIVMTPQLQQAIKLLQSLRGENEIEVRLTRGGSSLTLTAT